MRTPKAVVRQQPVLAGLDHYDLGNAKGDMREGRQQAAKAALLHE